MKERRFTDSERNIYESFCKQKENSMIVAMKEILTKYYKELEFSNQYIVTYGNIPVILVAHADTVFQYLPIDFYYDKEKNVIWSPDGMGADDRAGLFAIYKIIQEYKLRPHIIITTGEEEGCLGAIKLINSYKFWKKPVNFMIELDRRGECDSVYYNCDNPEFEKYINSFGFTTAIGSFSDISILAPHFNIAAVNLSVGYYDEHSYTEYLHVGALFNTIEKVVNILNNALQRPIVWMYIEAKKEQPIFNYNTEIENLFDEAEYCDACNREINMGKANKIFYVVPAGSSFSNSGDYEMLYLCDSCFGSYNKQLFFCDHCNEAWTALSEKDKRIVNNKWLCPKCRKNKKSYKKMF